MLVDDGLCIMILCTLNYTIVISKYIGKSVIAAVKFCTLYNFSSMYSYTAMYKIVTSYFMIALLIIITLLPLICKMMCKVATYVYAHE